MSDLKSERISPLILAISAEILKILLHDEPLAPDVDLKVLARKTESFSGSDLKRTSLCIRSLSES